MNDVGGIAGYSSVNNNLEFCYSESDISAEDFTGGFIGSADGYTTIENCYAAGDVSGAAYVGGFIGFNGHQSNDIINCYSVGEVEIGSYVGGFAGRNLEGSTSACFFDIDTSGRSYGAGIGVGEYQSGIHGRTTAQMKQEETFRGYNWNFDDVWDIEEDETYPFLRSNSLSPLKRRR